MEFISTRDSSLNASFKEALFKGLSADGGLFHPARKIDLKDYFASLKQGTSFNDIAREVTFRVLGPEISMDAAGRIVSNAFDFIPELKRVNNNLSILELYHGPSCAFKDFGASFMASAMEEFLTKDDKHTVILVATSGDTGSAVAKAFHKKKNIDVVILYPSGRVSVLQEKQLTTLGDNVSALEVKGSFDDCQRMVKEAFMDKTLNEKLVLTSANSINLGRLFPQSFYYIYAYSLLSAKERDNYYFCVPSGNFGNLTAGLYAWQWGLPLKGFIAATNINDVVPHYLTTKNYNPRSSVQTLSNAMDVGNPSNFERMKTIFNDSHAQMSSVISSEVVTDSDTKKTIKRIYDTNKIFIDPHTAVGYLASERFIESNKLKDSQIVVLSTAHPAKFIETVEEATGKKPPLPEQLEKTMKLPKVSVVTGNNLKELSDFLMKKFG